MTVVLDASASLAFSQGEAGSGRVCLALGDRLDAVVLTADTAWGASGRVQQIR